jgi:hypothetical protein
MARSIPYGSTPRSNRVDASLRNPSRAADCPMPSGSNHATSRTTTSVASVISLSRPPMIPPMPIGTSLASQISRSAGVNARSNPSSVVITSPSRARRMTNPPPPSMARS